MTAIIDSKIECAIIDFSIQHNNRTGEDRFVCKTRKKRVNYVNFIKFRSITVIPFFTLYHLTYNQQTCRMKTTFDLPPDLIRELKFRALNEGEKLKEIAAELLKRGLAVQENGNNDVPSKIKIVIQSNGLPVVRCAANAPAKRMTVDELLAIEQRSLNQADAQYIDHAL